MKMNFLKTKILMNLMLSIMLFGTLIIVACNKDKNNDNIIQNSLRVGGLSNAANEVLNAPSLIEINMAATLLNDSEREHLWLTKFNTILSNDAERLSPAQKGIVEMWKNYLIENGMSGMRNNLEQLDALFRENLSYMEENFTQSQIYFLIETPYFTEDFSIITAEEDFLRLSPAGGLEASTGTCVCRFFGCSRGYSCTEGCTVSENGGCGPMGWFNCVGTCKLPLPEKDK